MWETIFESKSVIIQSKYTTENSILGTMEYRLTAYDDKSGKEITMTISPHEVINIMAEALEKQVTVHTLGKGEE